MLFQRRILALYYVSVFFIWLSVTLVQPTADPQPKNDADSKTANSCDGLLMGQYLCNETEIDPNTQQAVGCDKESRIAKVWCELAPGVQCAEQFPNKTFQRNVPCKWTNGHSFEKALILSVFLGMFGVDRFYLGYPAIGLVKFATLGFMFLGQLVDILLIATQVVKPSDGSEYVIDFYGAAVQRIMRNNYTYLKTPDYG